LAGRRILLGVSGGIAAYKSAVLVRELVTRGAQVRVVLTEGGSRFITALTLQALSGNRVHQQWLDTEGEAAMGHIELARWAELVLVAPASADFLARLSHGLADDLLATLCLATSAPIAVAPAMNRQMWAAAATRANCDTLAGRGVLLWGPAQGEQACGEVGPGRMLEPEALVLAAERQFADGCLAGKRVLITAGPTREDIDPVRFVSNRSSGRMGFALAMAAQRAGAQVCLVAGPVGLDTPAGVDRVDVWSAQQMLDAVMQRVADQDIFIACAAVADYRPQQAMTRKLKKTDAQLTLQLQRCPDILAAVAALADGPFTLGFAAETENLATNARAKLINKRLDMLAANPVGQPGAGFDGDNNALRVFWRDGALDLGRDSKMRLAERLIKLLAETLAASPENEMKDDA
jgi:phosphopantothenoylcysteine decarboxylase/phosphopantothenate--cysteine ligase